MYMQTRIHTHMSTYKQNTHRVNYRPLFFIVCERERERESFCPGWETTSSATSSPWVFVDIDSNKDWGGMRWWPVAGLERKSFKFVYVWGSRPSDLRITTGEMQGGRMERLIKLMLLTTTLVSSRWWSRCWRVGKVKLMLMTMCPALTMMMPVTRRERRKEESLGVQCSESARCGSMMHVVWAWLQLLVLHDCQSFTFASRPSFTSNSPSSFSPPLLRSHSHSPAFERSLEFLTGRCQIPESAMRAARRFKSKYKPDEKDGASKILHLCY